MSPVPVLGHLEGAAVGVDGGVGIVGGDQRRRPGLAPGIRDVDVDRDAVAMQLDVRRHRDFRPAGGVEVRLPEIGHPFSGVLRVVVLPVAVERAVERRLHALAVGGELDGLGRLGVRADHHARVGRFVVHAGELRVFPVRQGFRTHGGAGGAKSKEQPQRQTGAAGHLRGTFAHHGRPLSSASAGISHARSLAWPAKAVTDSSRVRTLRMP